MAIQVGDKVPAASLKVATSDGKIEDASTEDLFSGKFGMGTRSQRYAFVAEDGVVTHLAVEAPMKFGVSSADAILGAL